MKVIRSSIEANQTSETAGDPPATHRRPTGDPPATHRRPTGDQPQSCFYINFSRPPAPQWKKVEQVSTFLRCLRWVAGS